MREGICLRVSLSLSLSVPSVPVRVSVCLSASASLVQVLSWPCRLALCPNHPWRMDQAVSEGVRERASWV